MKLDQIEFGAIEKMGEIYAQRTTRAIFELLQLQDFVDLKTPFGPENNIVPVALALNQ
jgi:hypothetical protein